MNWEWFAIGLAILAVIVLAVRQEKKNMNIDDEIKVLRADTDAVKATVATQAQKIADLSAELAAAGSLTSAQQAALDGIHADLSAIAAPAPTPSVPPAAA